MIKEKTFRLKVLYDFLKMFGDLQVERVDIQKNLRYGIKSSHQDTGGRCIVSEGR